MTRRMARCMQRRPAAALGALALVMVAPSVWAETPLSLLVSETLTYDSNILKNNNNKYRDVKSTTGVKVGFDKDYGRQNYNASVLVLAERFKNSKDYDNDGYKINLGFSTDIASNAQLSVTTDKVRQLQDLRDQGNRRYAETIETTNTSVLGRYGLHGRWSTSANLTHGKVSYKVNDQLSKTYDGIRLGARYSPTDLMYFDAGVRRLKSFAPKYPIYGISGIDLGGDDVRRSDIDFVAHWEVTGFSTLDARMAVTKERHLTDESKDFKGLTGRLNWSFTPKGKLSYNLLLERDTNNEGGFTSFVGGVSVQKQNRLTTSAEFTARWQAAPKVSMYSTAIYKRLEEDLDHRSSGFDAFGSVKASYKSLSVGLKYNPRQFLAFDCSVEVYDRAETIFGSAFDGETVSCSAVFSLD